MSFSIGYLICSPHLILPPCPGVIAGVPFCALCCWRQNWLHSWCGWAGWAMGAWQPPPLTKIHFCMCSQESLWVRSVVFPWSKLTEENRALCDWRLAKCFKGFLLCSPCGTVQGSQALSWRRQMDQMTPLGPLESCFVWMLESISLGGIFDLQCAFVFNFLYIVKLCSTRQAADLDVLGAHRVICLGCRVIPDGITVYLKFIYLNQLGWTEIAITWQLLGNHDDFKIPILDSPVLKFLGVNFQRIK